MIEPAQDYQANGWSVLPLKPRGKEPLVPWQKFQQHRATALQVMAWWNTWPEANVGVVTGTVSGLVVVDLDGEEGLGHAGRFPETMTARTGRGRHLYYAHPGGLVVSRIGLLPHVDVRGDGGYVVAPPSVHPSGAVYAWAERTWDGPLTALPDWITTVEPVGATPQQGQEEASQRQKQNAPAAPDLAALPPVLEGHRRGHLWRLGRSLRAQGAGAQAIEAMMRAENADRCQPPLPEPELTTLIQQVRERPDRPK
jgi:hypothetical protein